MIEMQACMTRDSIVSNLVSVGFRKDFSENLYEKYKSNGRIEGLLSYILTKRFVISEPDDTIPLRDI